MGEGEIVYFEFAAFVNDEVETDGRKLLQCSADLIQINHETLVQVV
jgi:hypothetical protein